MTFTVVRAVRGIETTTAAEYQDKLQRLVRAVAPSVPAAAMDIPYADEVIRLNLDEFPETVPGALG
jgi:hypothetical protein